MAASTCDICGKVMHGDEPRGFCCRCLVQAGMAWADEDVAPAQPPESHHPADWEETPDGAHQAKGGMAAELRQFGDYELLEEVGRGGMGIVYRARQVSLNRTVAVKMILAGQFADRAVIRRFQAEAEAAASLHHPNIVAIHETGEYLGHPYFSMEFVEGRNLAEVGKDNKLSPTEVAQCMQKIAEAVQCAHEQGILHRDLKPSNVLFDRNNEPRVTDFGLAKRLEGKSDLTLSGQMLGSPDYMAPEQASSERGRVSVRSDVYAMGAMMYYLLMGQPIYQAATVPEALQLLLNTEPKAPRQCNPNIPRDLENICLKCLEKEPQRRYGSARELAEDLGRFLQDEPVSARPIRSVEKLWRWCRRKPILASLSGAALIMFLTIAIGLPIATLNIMRSRDRVRLNEYSASMGMVQEALKRDNLGLARDYLESFIPEHGQPDLRGFEWHYYWGQVQPQFKATLPGHSNSVRAVKFSPQGDNLASLGEDGQLKIWEVATGKLVQSIKPDGRLATFEYTPDGKSILLGFIGSSSKMRKGLIKEWNLSSNKLAPLFETASARFKMAATETVIAVTQPLDNGAYLKFGPVELWDFRSRQKSILPEPGRIVTFSEDGLRLAADTTNGTIKVWDWRKSEVIYHIESDKDDICPIAFSTDGKYLAFKKCFESKIWIWDFAHGRVVPGLEIETGHIAFSKFDPDLFVAAGRSINLWSLSERRKFRELRGHAGEIHCVDFSPTNLLLASCGGKQSEIVLWTSNQLRSASNTPTLPMSVPSHYDIHKSYGWPRWPIVSPDGRWLASSDAVGQIELRDVTKEGAQHLLGKGMTPVWFSIDSQILAAFKLGEAPNPNFSMFRRFLAVVYWDVETLQKVGQIDFSDDQDVFFDAAVSRQRNYLAAHMFNAKLAPRIRVWRIEAQTNLIETIDPIPHWSGRTPLAISSQGLLAFGDRSEEQIRFKDLHKGQERIISGKSFWTFMYSPDEKNLLGEWGDTIHLWEVATGKKVGEIKENMGSVRRFDISPDGKTLASISGNTMTWWYLPNRKPVGIFDFKKSLLSVNFSPVGNYLAVGLEDRIEFFRTAAAPPGRSISVTTD